MIRMIFEMLQALWDHVFDPVRPRPLGLYTKDVDHSVVLPPADGRFFAWFRARNTRLGMVPAIIRDVKIGGTLEYVGEKHVLSPAEYGDTIAELVERYPAPKIEE